MGQGGGEVVLVVVVTAVEVMLAVIALAMW